MTFEIEFTTAALRQLRKLPRPAAERVALAIGQLREDPRPPASRKLVGEETAWRLRVGDYRVIYDIHDEELVVEVVRTGHRREVYDR